MGDGKQNDEIVVIGAGLIGALIAHTLASRGRQVAVLEAQRAGQGATAHAVGLVTPQLTQAALPGTLHGVDEMTTLSMQLGMVPRSCRVLHLATAQVGVDALQMFCTSYGGDRPKMVWETQPGGLPAGFTAGLVVHYSVLLDVAALTKKLLLHPAITVRENAEVHALDYHAGKLVVLAHGYTLRCAALVLATNAYAGLLSPYLADAVQTARGYSWTSRQLNDQPALMDRVQKVVPVPLVIDDGQMIVSQTPDDRLRINAWRTTDDEGADPAEDVLRFLHEHLPELLNYTQDHRSGVTTVARDGAPLIGKLVGDGAVFYALGAGVYGPAWAPAMVERVARMMNEV
jgi:glycine/D-amino acid oxidase-like deaminating enzyme